MGDAVVRDSGQAVGVTQCWPHGTMVLQLMSVWFEGRKEGQYCTQVAWRAPQNSCSSCICTSSLSCPSLLLPPCSVLVSMPPGSCCCCCSTLIGG